MSGPSNSLCFDLPVPIPPPQPQPPSSFTVSENIAYCSSGAPQVRIAWNSASGVTQYRIYRDGQWIASTSPDITAYTDVSAVAGTQYQYYAEAYNDAGVTRSETVSVSVDSKICYVPPPPPADVAISDTTAYCSAKSPRVRLAWNTAAGASEYRINRDGIWVAIVSADTISYIDAEVLAGNTYQYRIGAYNDSGITLSEMVAISVDPKICFIDPPSLLAGSVSSANLLSLTWKDNSSIENNFTIQRNFNGGEFEYVATPDADVTSWSGYVATVPKGNYCYRVLASAKEQGVSTPSNSACFDLPVQPASKTVYEDAEDKKTLGWIISDASPTGAKITNIADPIRGRVISLKGSKLNNGYTLRKENGTLFGNTKEFIATWRMKFSEAYQISWAVTTSDSSITTITYSSAYPDGCKKNLKQIECGFSGKTTDATWYQVTRDLNAIVKSVRPTASVTRINSFSVRGSGLIDEVALMSAF